MKRMRGTISGFAKDVTMAKWQRALEDRASARPLMATRGGAKTVSGFLSGAGYVPRPFFTA
jgi:hypothetical protein